MIFDPSKIDRISLLRYSSHASDPTQLNRQGMISEPHYRSVIFIIQSPREGTHIQ